MEYSTATRLIGLAMPPPVQPLHEVIARLEAPAGESWLSRALISAPLSELPACDLLIHGGLELATLERVKALATAQAAGAGDERLHAVLAYFLVCASARLHGNCALSRRPKEEVATALLDLATAMPAPWADFLGRAAARCLEA